jgi:polysaccharide pyruvyl transferase CsaB
MRVLIIGNYGNGNNGDEVVLMAIVQELRELDPATDITVVSGDPVATKRMHGVEAIRRAFSLRVVRAIAQCDAVIIGGGGILIDQVHSNLKYGLAILTAKFLRKPVMVHAVGLDTLTKPVARAAVRFAFNRVDLIAVRDEASRDEMLKLGVDRAPMHVTADPAFTLDVPPVQDFREILTQAGLYEKQSPLLGISVWPTDNLNSYSGVVPVFAELADRLVVTYDGRVVFLVMSTIEFEGDLAASHRIIEMMEHRDRAQVFGAGCHPRVLLAAFGQMDLVIGMRYHSLILSAVAGVPFIAVERAKYPKNTYFLCEAQQLSAGMAESLTVDGLAECVARVWREKEEMTRRVIAARQGLCERAGRHAQLFAQLTAQRRGRHEGVQE